MPGTLSIVATPIGNLSDITLRALETLKKVDLILCEDTRVTKKLLDHFQILKPVKSYHHHSDAKTIKDIKELLLSGQELALVTDAGTPGMSDPGNELIQHLTKNDNKVKDEQFSGDSKIINQTPIKIVPLPGASAVTTALSICGFPTDKFIFLGFPPHKNKRRAFFQEILKANHTVVFFESGHRIKKCISELAELLTANRGVVIGRELTKMFETVYRGTMPEIMNMKMDERGEFVIVVRAT